MDLNSGQFLQIILFFSGKKWTTPPLLIQSFSNAKWYQMILYEDDKVTTFIMYGVKVSCNCQHSTKRGIQGSVFFYQTRLPHCVVGIRNVYPAAILLLQYLLLY